MSTWWASARPSSQGRPACLIDESGEAPVPPSWPEMRMASACALATPAATVPDAHLGHELDADARPRVGVLEVVDELLEVLDGVDVVVRRRRDEAHARASSGAMRAMRLVDLVAGQLAALAGLGALGHLDLQLVGVDEVVGGHAEAARGHLLDGRAHAVAVGQRLVARRVLAALAGVGARRPGGSWRWPASCAPPTRSSRRTWRRWRSAARCARTGSTSSRGTGARSRELEQVAQRDGRLGVVVDEARVLPVQLVVARAHGLLQLGDGLRVVQVALAAQAPLVEAARLQLARRRRRVHVKAAAWRISVSCSMRRHVDAADARHGAREVLLDDLVGETHGLEDLGPDVRGDRGDAHLGHRLEQALADGLDVVVARLRARRGWRAAARAGACPRWSRRPARG